MKVQNLTQLLSRKHKRVFISTHVTEIGNRADIEILLNQPVKAKESLPSRLQTYYTTYIISFFKSKPSYNYIRWAIIIYG